MRLVERAGRGGRGELLVLILTKKILTWQDQVNQSATVFIRGCKSCDLSSENVPCEIRLNGCVRGKLTGDSRVVKSFSRLKRTIERVSSRAQRD